MSFTVNSTVSVGEWTVIDAYSTNVSTSTELLATKAGHRYLVKGFTITMLDTDGKWVKIFNDTDLRIGPFSPYNRLWPVRYESAMVFEGAIKVQTESGRQIHITMDYRIVPE